MCDMFDAANFMRFIADIDRVSNFKIVSVSLSHFIDAKRLLSYSLVKHLMYSCESFFRFFDGRMHRNELILATW